MGAGLGDEEGYPAGRTLALRKMSELLRILWSSSLLESSTSESSGTRKTLGRSSGLLTRLAAETSRRIAMGPYLAVPNFKRASMVQGGYLSAPLSMDIPNRIISPVPTEEGTFLERRCSFLKVP